MRPRRLPLTIHPSSVVLLLLTLVAYLPAITHGGFIWDDPDYVLNNRLLRTPGGLWTIWTSPSSLPQYYPLVHTTYWVEYQLAGLSPHLYHATNVLLHALSAVLLYKLLTRLEVPGALFAAGLFAVHPVMVESVAWVTERKNTLSMPFYLGAFLFYWRFVTADAPRRADYVGALLLFVCALLSKTVTCSLPAAILVVLWWKERLSRRTALPLVPFFAVGLVMGLYTAYLERTHVGALGVEFDLSPAARVLIASRACLFYAGKLLAPYPLSFIYPRWQIDPGQVVQWVPLVTCLLITAGLVYLARRRRRGPLAAWLLFVGTLVPALGFFNVYPMRYSFVADHFQYHAAPALLALIAAVLAHLIGPRPQVRNPQWVVLVPLVAMTFGRCWAYESPLALWEDTARKNPGSWMVHVNLGHALVNANDLDRAHAHYARAVEVAPEQPEALINLGGILAKRGRYAEAREQFDRALAAKAEYPPALFGIGSAHLARDDAAGAIPWLERAVAASPDYAQAHYHLGRVYEKLGDPEKARQSYEAAVAHDPDDADALYNLGTLYLNHNRPAEAADRLRQAVSIRPNRADYHANLASAYLKLGDAEAALAEYSAAAKLDPAMGAQIRAFLARRGVTLP